MAVTEGPVANPAGPSTEGDYMNTLMNSMKLIIAAALCFWLATSHASAIAMQHHQHGQRQRDDAKSDAGLPGLKGKTIQVGAETKTLPDLVLLDQDGRRVRFYSDLIKDKVVLISFFYTSCNDICLAQGEVFSKLQDELGDRLGKEVFLLSVTIDPETDTPGRLKKWGEQHGLKSGWTLLTGSIEEMGKLVGHLTGNPLGRIDLHSAFIYAGDDRRNVWTTAYGLSAPAELVKRIDELIK